MLADAIQGLRGCVLALGLSVFVFLSLRYRPRFIWGVRNGGVRRARPAHPHPVSPWTDAAGRPRAGLTASSPRTHPETSPRDVAGCGEASSPGQ